MHIVHLGTLRDIIAGSLVDMLESGPVVKKSWCRIFHVVFIAKCLLVFW